MYTQTRRAADRHRAGEKGKKIRGVSPLFCGENEMPFGEVAQASGVVDDGDNLVAQLGSAELENGVLGSGGGGLGLKSSLDSSENFDSHFF